VLLVVAATELELARLPELDTFVCGVGPVEAALRTARVLAERRPAAIVHAGIAGGRGLLPGTLVLGSESIYCDVLDPGSALPRVERVEPDAEVLARARDALPEALVLPIGTAGRIGAGTACEVEAMEGFGVLRAAELAGVPAVELRAVSNAPGESDRSRWSVDESLALLAGAVSRVAASLVTLS
jgi:futalosine hydrolase